MLNTQREMILRAQIETHCGLIVKDWLHSVQHDCIATRVKYIIKAGVRNLNTVWPRSVLAVK